MKAATRPITKPVCLGYIRVSTTLQKGSADTQRYEILKHANAKGMAVTDWIEERISGTKCIADRQLGVFIQERLKRNDAIVCTEISRLGRSMLDVLSVLHSCMQNGIFVYTCKEKFELGDNMSSKVLAFAFSLSAEIERQLLSQRTKEALAHKKSLGVVLGRPRGSKSHSVLDEHEKSIRELLAKGVSKASLAKIYDVNPGTIHSFIVTRNLMTSASKEAVTSSSP